MRRLVTAVASTAFLCGLGAACIRSGYELQITADGSPHDGAQSDQPADQAADQAQPDSSLSVGVVAPHFTMDTAPVAGIVRSVSGLHDAACGADRCPVATSGRVGGALQFDGVNDRLQVATSGGAFEATGGFTVSVWLKPSGPTDELRCAVTKIHSGVADNENSWGLFHRTGETYGFESYDGTSGHFIYSPPGAVKPGAWQHVAAAWNGKVKLLYVGGELVSAASKSVQFSGAELLIGADLDFNSHLFHFAGAIDELRIYSRCLDGAEIKALAAP